MKHLKWLNPLYALPFAVVWIAVGICVGLWAIIDLCFFVSKLRPLRVVASAANAAGEWWERSMW